MKIRAFRPVSKLLAISLTLAALLGIAACVLLTTRSPIFLVQVVEIGVDRHSTATATASTPDGDSAPVDPEEISDLAAVPVGRANLFSLDLGVIERRLLSHPWIRQVRLQKRFPQTLAISVAFREPRALLQGPSGDLSYVDVGGAVFGRVNVLTRLDLPLLVGIGKDDSSRIQASLELVSEWEKSALGSTARLSSLGWDENRGFRAWFTYPSETGSPIRAKIDLGLEGLDTRSDDALLTTRFRRLGEVVHYLAQHSLVASQIWAEPGKKIVVKTSRDL